MEKIAIIGSGIMAKVIAERATELDVITHCFSFDKNDVACNSVDNFHEVNIFDIERITHICKENGIGGVIATTELTILPAAKVARALNLNGNAIKVAEEITNKVLTRKKLEKATIIKQPWFYEYVEGEMPTIEEYPVIVKPIAAGGKRGICVVYNEKELKMAIEDALPYSKVKGVLIEEFLANGQEYSVESLSYNGQHYVIQVTQKDTSSSTRCNELGHHQPADIDDSMRMKVCNAITEMLTVLGIENGPCHTEIKIIGDEVFLIEVNARPGGDHITHPLTELSTGYPFVSGIIWIALNQFDNHKPLNLEKNFAGIYFITEETAYLQDVFEECENYPWLYVKHQVNESPSKIMFNDEEGLNYFIYFDKKKKPDVMALIQEKK